MLSCRFPNTGRVTRRLWVVSQTQRERKSVSWRARHPRRYHGYQPGWRGELLEYSCFISAIIKFAHQSDSGYGGISNFHFDKKRGGATPSMSINFHAHLTKIRVKMVFMGTIFFVYFSENFKTPLFHTLSSWNIAVLPNNLISSCWTRWWY